MLTRSRIKLFVTLAVVLALMIPLALVGIASAKPLAWDNGLARTPPMGWNSWNKFGCSVSDTLIRAQADAMVSSGMAAAGYQYVNIDDCWSKTARDANGNLQPDATRFPNGMKALADYVHSKGLKLGIYGDRGTSTCSGYPGSYSHETADANQFAAWGVDYLKYDNCAAVGDLVTDYTTMHNALAATGRPIIFSICSWWMASTAFVDIGHLWRTSGDISDSFSVVMGLMDTNNTTAQYAGPGHWNDPDMLEVGNGGMTDTEYRAHFSMWAIMAAPLIAGNDLANMSSATVSILTAPEVIAIDQDALGVQGTRVIDNGDLEVWAKTLSGTNTKAVALLNRSASAASITVNWSDIGLSGSATVRDLWARSDLGSFSGSYTASVPSHGVVLVKIVAGGGVQLTNTPTRTFTPVTVVPTFTKTSTPITPVVNTPTSTLGASPTLGLTSTRTRTATTGPTATQTRTPSPGASRTPTTGPSATRTNTPATVVPTFTNTPVSGACSPVTSTITAPFTFDGAGTFCWKSSNLGGFINSWNTTNVTINGMNVTNLWMSSGSYPAQIGGFWYVSYNSSVAWGHFEAK